MSFKVDRAYNGYRISTGDGQPVRVKTVDEIRICLDHYFADAAGHGGRMEGCAFCVQIRKRNAA